MKFTIDPKELAHCRCCYEPMYIIKDSSVRDYCHECLLEMSIENAKEIVGK